MHDSHDCKTHEAKRIMQTAFWIAFGVVDILTEASLVLVSLMLVWQLHISIARKAVVVGCFAPRIL